MISFISIKECPYPNEKVYSDSSIFLKISWRAAAIMDEPPLNLTQGTFFAIIAGFS
jgi:hypothetical protein